MSKAVVVNPAIVDVVECKRRGAADHAEPIVIVYEKIRPANGSALIIAGLETVDGTDMPSADPVRGPIAVEASSIGDHAAEIDRSPIIGVEHDKVRFLVAIEVCHIVA